MQHDDINNEPVCGLEPTEPIADEIETPDAETNLARLIEDFEAGKSLRQSIAQLDLYPDAVYFGLFIWSDLYGLENLKLEAWKQLNNYLYRVLERAGYLGSLGTERCEELKLDFLYEYVPQYRTHELVLPFFTPNPPVALSVALKADAANVWDKHKRLRNHKWKYGIQAEEGHKSISDRMDENDPDSESFADCSLAEPTTLETVDSNPQITAFYELIERLEPDERQFITRILEGYQVQEIAADLGITPNAASQRKAKIIKKLRHIYGEARIYGK